MIDAKFKGEGIEDEEAVEPDRSNVLDLMAALKSEAREIVSSGTVDIQPPHLGIQRNHNGAAT
jgi:non-homologous end joining protein Ku